MPKNFIIDVNDIFLLIIGFSKGKTHLGLEPGTQWNLDILNTSIPRMIYCRETVLFCKYLVY